MRRGLRDHASRRFASSLVVLCALACGKKGPSVSGFKATPQGPVSPGTAVTLTFNVSSDATKVSIDNGVGIVTGSTATVTPSATTTYTLTATSGRGSSSAALTVPVLASLRASPEQIAPGGSSTLSWDLGGLQLAASLDNGPTVPAGATSVAVSPSTTTRYTLSFDGQPAATVVVRVTPAPHIAAFAAAPPSVAPGAHTRLSWSASGATSFVVTDDHGGRFAVGGATTLDVHPAGPATTYTLTADGPTGQGTQTLTVQVSGAQGAALVYTDPPPGTAPVALVHDAASTPDHVVLALVATASVTPLTGLALNLPLDAASPGSRDGVSRVRLHQNGPAPDFTVSGIDTGPGTAAQAIALPQSGPLAGMIVLGLSQKPSAAGGSGNPASPAPGTVLARFSLDLVPTGGPGVVFDGTAGPLGGGFRAQVRVATGQPDGIAIGKLEVQ